MKTSSAKAKGRRFAQEVKDLLLKAATSLEEDDIVVTSSGDTGEDLKLSPHARDVYPVSIECKNQEKLNVWEALKQAETNAGIYTPVLFFKRNRSKAYAVVSAETLVNLVRYYKKGDRTDEL
jgi:hypothetical protein